MDEPSAEFLASVPLFAGLPRRELRRIAGGMKGRVFAPGETLTAEGEGGVGFFVIEAGQARVEAGGSEVSRLGPRDHFGEIAVLGRGDRTATVVAETEVRTWGMTPWVFRPLVEGNPTIAFRLLEQLATRLAR